MKRIQTSTQTWKCKIRIKGSKVQITNDEGEFVIFDKENCPPTIRAGEYMVNFTDDKIRSIYPVDVIAKVRFIEFMHRQDTPPSPMQHTGKFGPYMSCTVLCKIIEGEYKGMEIPAFMSYLFAEGDDGNAVLSGGGKNADLLQSFLEATGVWETSFKFTDNLLPQLQKNILKKGLVFRLLLKDGRIGKFSEIPTEDEDETEPEEDEEEEPEEQPVASRKPVKKTGKKPKPAEDDDDDSGGFKAADTGDDDDNIPF
jgi:hypothetical protein